MTSFQQYIETILRPPKPAQGRGKLRGAQTSQQARMALLQGSAWSQRRFSDHPRPRGDKFHSHSSGQAHEVRPQGLPSQPRERHPCIRQGRPHSPAAALPRRRCGTCRGACGRSTRGAPRPPARAARGGAPERAPTPTPPPVPPVRRICKITACAQRASEPAWGSLRLGSGVLRMCRGKSEGRCCTRLLQPPPIGGRGCTVWLIACV